MFARMVMDDPDPGASHPVPTLPWCDKKGQSEGRWWDDLASWVCHVRDFGCYLPELGWKVWRVEHDRCWGNTPIISHCPSCSSKTRFICDNAGANGSTFLSASRRISLIGRYQQWRVSNHRGKNWGWRLSWKLTR
jgi:rubredoxin